MTERITKHSGPGDWLRSSILEPYVSQYCTHLESQGYARNTQRVYLCCVSHFAHWSKKSRVSLGALDERITEAFLHGHLPRCSCSSPVRRSAHEIRPALKHLLRVLRMRNAIPPVRPPKNRIETELLKFEKYMEETCGLAVNTRKQRGQIVRRFLANQRNAGIAASRTRPTHIRQFVLSCQNHCPGTIHVIGGAIRSYLRFRAVSGDRVRHLLASVPTVANWRLAVLPEVLTDGEIQEALESFRQLRDSPKRAYAIMRCLVDLGLRASEVVQLTLDDIDWRKGTLCLSGSKSRRTDILPLPAATGAAIADYVKAERPKSANRRLFVRHVAPYEKPIGPGVARRVVRDAYRRCGWTRTRVHILRHSLASRLLRVGTPLKQIADILRHRSLDTSAIYTKVDSKRLESVSLPWLGGSYEL
jgi:integrase/recombinase XerD